MCVYESVMKDVGYSIDKPLAVTTTSMYGTPSSKGHFTSKMTKNYGNEEIDVVRHDSQLTRKRETRPGVSQYSRSFERIHVMYAKKDLP